MRDKSLDSIHWLMRPRSIRVLWFFFGLVLFFTVIAQVFVPVKGYFEIDGWFAFAAIFGFVSCVLMVMVAKLIGVILKRKDDYYHD